MVLLAKCCVLYRFEMMYWHLLQAKEMLLLNRKLTAQEALDRGLLTEVYPDNVFQEEAWKRVREIAKLPPNVSRTSGRKTINISFCKCTLMSKIG